MKYNNEADILEPEVIPPGSSSGARVAEATAPGGINPIIAGLVIDIINMFTYGFLGFIAGAAVGYWAANSNRAPTVVSLLIGVATGWYCGLPLPWSIPLATLVGVIIVLWRKRGR